MNVTDRHYANLIMQCLDGEDVQTRNSRCRRALCARFRFTSTPLVGARKTAWRNCLREWEWFMSGSSYLADLHESVRDWWRPWASKFGNVPFNYSRQFRFAYGSCGYVDQIERCVESLRDHPNSRRNVLTTWNAAEMWSRYCPITNCHNTVTQVFVERGAVCMKTYQRSADVICGVPHNWLQQWAFLVWLAHRAGRPVGWLEWEGGDCHVYEAHAGLAERILNTDPAPAPELVYRPAGDGETFRAEDFTLSGPYTPAITERAEMVV